NSQLVTAGLRAKLDSIRASLPADVVVDVVYDRTSLVDKVIETVQHNLFIAAVIVLLVLFALLGNLRAGLLVAVAIPISMLFAVQGMHEFAIAASLLSLGAIDFGILVDGSVVMTESNLRALQEAQRRAGGRLSADERLRVIAESSARVVRPIVFGMAIITLVFVPVLTLEGIEGKMFRPMAAAVLLALAGALVLSLTLTPALCALFLRPSARGENHGPYAAVRQRYQRLLLSVLERPRAAAIGALLLVGTCIGLFPLLGSEFLPDLDEGAVAVNHARMKSISLDQSIRQTTLVERELRALPEVETVVSRIGRPEIATDPMGVELVDTYAFLKPAQQWRPGVTKEDLVAEMDARLDAFPGVVASFSQPIKFRMMELIEGVGARADVVVKIYGDDMDQLLAAGARIGEILTDVEGGRDVQVQRVSGLPMLEVRVDREAAARYGVDVADVLQVVQTAIAGTQATTVLEGFRRFDLVVRLPEWARANAATVGDLLVTAPEGERVPLRLLARIEPVEGPAEISRDNGQRRLAVEANVRGRDIGSFVDEARARVDAELDLPAGYLVDWGGTFEHLESGRERLLVVVPITFGFILVLLVTALRSVPQALLVFTGIPFAISGGVLALLVRDMPFSMSAGVGFVAVSGVAVLNGVVLVTYINQLRELGHGVREATLEGAMARLRPVLLTALVASLGFVPMALSTATGAEVQKPLATVVIGGIVTDTVLTLLVLPALYRQAARPPTSRGSRHRSGWA
ncbi:MAG: CusA/CzcA family heavy metal efflux RND transporter, partial [Gemmatimonadaceae bacterium]|nr:CusA/CzcA family heavy metal efflux RND transporter [Gemmatimonadaceae bacterium]